MTLACANGACAYPTSCADLHLKNPDLGDGIYAIDPGDGAPYEVYCDMIHGEGGWTLTMVVSDDGQNTWTWDTRDLFSTNEMVVGSIEMLNRDFKSPAHHDLEFYDLLFVHAPSEMWAEYDDVGAGSESLAELIASIDEPVCNYGLAGDGYPLSAGTLLGKEEESNLCDTDLYFNLGDHEGNQGNIMDCEAFGNNSTYGPGWNHGGNAGCPFDDPSDFALGPEYGDGNTNFPDVEERGLGFARALGLNAGEAGSATNFMHIYVR